MIPGPPTIYQSLLAHPKRKDYDLSSMRLAVTGAAPVPVKLVNQMRHELGFETVVTAYGLTESCGVVSICRPDDTPEQISHSSGRAMPGVELKYVDARSRARPRGCPSGRSGTSNPRTFWSVDRAELPWPTLVSLARLERCNAGRLGHSRS
eukprot:scaffold140115_cov44-Attheya_sp.AAC.4